MQFKQDAPVYSSDNQDVGRVDRVVLNPKTKEITHIVVRKGLLFTTDRIVPLDVVDSASEDQVILRLRADALEDLPLYEEIHYVPLNADEIESAAYPVGMASPLYWYVPTGGWSEYAPTPPAFRPETRQNIPEDTVAVKEGARVYSADGKHIGNVERVFTDAATDHATAFLISQGLLLKEQKTIPVAWVRTMSEHEIHLTVGSTMLKDLHDYQKA